MELKAFFEEHSEVAIAFSGGVDSAYLLYAALKYAKRVHAYYVKSPFQPQFELEDAKRLAEELHAEMTIIEKDPMQVPEVKANPSNRCYYCKQVIFGNILAMAKADGFIDVLDGTNASDDASDRPGMRVLEELNVYSPLRICNLTKAEIRQKSKEAGLFTWDKPAYACLATRIPTGREINYSDLERTEWAEEYLMNLGFSDFRVRLYGDGARVQIRVEDMERLLKNRENIVHKLEEKYGAVLLDLKTR